MKAPHLKKELSKIHLLLISFAAIFGSGWLFAPLYAAQIAGPASLIAWVIGAMMAAVIGITLAEVIVLFPQNGGLSEISKVTHGEFLSLLITMLNLLVFIILPAIEVRAVLQYLSSYFQFLVTPENSISMGGYLLAFFLLTFITWINVYGAKVTTAFTQAVVLFKVLTPLLLCISFLFVLWTNDALDHSRLWSSPVSWTAIFQAIATSGIIFSFNGFNQATLFAGEAKNPQKAIPFAILGSLLISGLLYFLIQYVFLMALPESSFAQGWSKLSFVGDEGPFVGIALLLGLGWLSTVIYADAVISPLGTAFSYASAAPRLLQGLTGSFQAAVIMTLVLECLAFLFLPSLKAMIALLVAAFVLCYTIAPASLLRLRKTHAHLHRPFRVKMAPFISYLSLFFSNLMVFSCGWIALRNLICISAGFILLYLIFQIQQKKSLFKPLRGSEWFFFQLFSIGALCWFHQASSLSFLSIFIQIAGTSAIALMLSQKLSSTRAA